MEIKTISSEEYEKYSKSLTYLYIDTFSNGKSFQYHDQIGTQNYLKSIFDCGYGLLAFNGQQLVGAILLTPLKFDDLVPSEIVRKFEVNKAVYVAEMMVEKSQQGKGIGKKLLLSFIETADKKKYTNAFIRVWTENEGAIALYQKMGFTKCASIVQAKLLADKSQMFNFEKIYLHQKLID